MDYCIVFIQNLSKSDNSFKLVFSNIFYILNSKVVNVKLDCTVLYVDVVHS